jgi:arabinofuranosyltransferase
VLTTTRVEKVKLSDNLKILLLFIIALAIRLALIPFFNFSFDDAYINFRIARNLARGYGMVFNPGEHVLATTTILYTLVMTPTYWLGITFPLWSKIINSLAMAGSIVLFFIILKGRIREGLAWFICLYLTFNYVVISQDLLGMEASLVILCLILATYLLQTQRGWFLGFILGALFLVRPEGMFAALLFWLSVLIFKRQLFWRTSIPLAVAAICWISFCQSYYGTLIPNTYSAKLAFFTTNPAPFTAQLNAVGRFLLTYIAFAPILILLLPLGIWRIIAHQKDLQPIAIWAVVILLMQLFSTFYLAPWYLAMVIPFIFLICVVGLEQLFTRVLPGVGRFFKLTVVIIIVCLCTVLYEAMVYLMTKDAMSDLKNADNLAGEIGRWLKGEKIPPKQVLAIEAIGRVGYESDMRILDTYGLASPEMIPLIKINAISGDSLTKFVHPDYILSIDPELGNGIPGYKVIKIFSLKQRMHGKNVPMQTFIYKKEE